MTWESRKMGRREGELMEFWGAKRWKNREERCLVGKNIKIDG